MGDFIARRLPWLPFHIILGVGMLSIGLVVYLRYFEPAPYEPVYSSPLVHTGTAKDRTSLQPVKSVAPGELFYTYREYCMRNDVQLMSIRRWLVGIDKHNIDIIYPFEIQVVAPPFTRKGCYNISRANEVPPLLNGRYALHAQVMIFTNLLRNDVIDLPAVELTIAGEAPVQRIARQDANIAFIKQELGETKQATGFLWRDLRKLQKSLDAHIKEITK